MTTPTFRAWLARQILRQDAVGDIARDVQADTCSADLGHAQVRAHLDREHHAIPAALTAYDRAVSEWQRHTARNR